MDNQKQLNVPVLGMTCANCVAAVERNAKKVDGVNDAVVNFASEKLLLSYDPAVAEPQVIVDQIHRAGYEIPTSTIEMPLVGMTCTNCASNIERALDKVDGVLDVSVNYASEKATITFIVGVTSRAELSSAVRRAGYEVVEAGDDEDLYDAEAEARAREIRHQEKRLLVGVIFTAPLLFLSMARDFGLLGAWSHANWVNWLFLALATPVQFYVGRDYYIGAYKSLRNGSANMDVLVALGSSAAYFYSIAVLIALTLGSTALGTHVYFETSATIITLIVLGKLLESRAKGHTSEAIKKLMGLRTCPSRRSLSETLL